VTPRFNQRQETTLERLGVQAVYLFGSRAMGAEQPLSDYDYGILMPDLGHSRGDPLYFSLYDLLTEVSPRTLANDVLDIVFVRDVGLELRFHVIRYGIVLYDRTPAARLDFEAQTTLLYCDFRPLLDQFDNAILESL